MLKQLAELRALHQRSLWRIALGRELTSAEAEALELVGAAVGLVFWLIRSVI